MGKEVCGNKIEPNKKKYKKTKKKIYSMISVLIKDDRLKNAFK